MIIQVWKLPRTGLTNQWTTVDYSSNTWILVDGNYSQSGWSTLR